MPCQLQTFAAVIQVCVSMGLCVRLSLPVIVLAALAILTVSISDVARDLQILIATVAVISTASVLGQALHIREFLSGLPTAMKDVVHNSHDAAFPVEVVAGELGQFSQEMQDFALKMRETLAERTAMERMAHSDALTGLPNRRGLSSLLDRLAGDPAAGRSLGGIGLLHLDLDHFKAVNDRLGHDAGDHVLCEAARLISAAIRDSDYLARLGGDEFVVVCPGVETDQVLVQIANRIIEKFSTPIIYETSRCHVGISIGMVLGGLRGKLLDPQRLLLNADVALCNAKANGRNRSAIFSTEMARSNRRQQNQAEEIRAGLEHDLFRPWFQPVVDLGTGQMVALHVQPRWESSAHGFIDPDDFMNTAEAFNLLEELGLRVVERACQAMSNWKRDHDGVPILQISLNRAQLLDANIADKISWCLDDANLVPDDLAFCAAEPFFAKRNAEVVVRNLDRLKSLGCPIILEEFGAANGSLSYIAGLQPTGVIAASGLTRDLATPAQCPTDTSLLSALVSAADGLGIVVAARDIESAGQLRILKDLGVPQAQGAEICTAKSEADLSQWLAHHGQSNGGPNAVPAAVSA